MGKLIVLEGIDGSGKSTQLRLITERLKDAGAEFATVTFPRYDSPSSAPVRMYLGGELGSRPGDVNAYAASVLFAADRLASYKSEEWGGLYDAGGLILMDRYTTSNAVHQGAKLGNEERLRFFRWLYDFEFNLLCLPKPDLVLYLDIDVNYAVSRLKSRPGAEDIHERDTEYLALCAECARRAASEYGWLHIDAARDKKAVFDDIISILQSEGIPCDD